MRKLLPILLILQIFCIASFAQEKIPTKQETMDWIAAKLKESLVSDCEDDDNDGCTRTFVSYSSGSFVYRRSWSGTEEEEKKGYSIWTGTYKYKTKSHWFANCTYTINLNLVDALLFDESGRVSIGTGKKQYRISNISGQGLMSNYCTVTGENPSYEKFNSVELDGSPFNLSYGLSDRFANAIRALIRFNGKNEPY